MSTHSTANQEPSQSPPPEQPRPVEITENGRTRCPYCGDLDCFAEWGNVSEIFKEARVDVDARVIVTGQGQIIWDAYEHVEYQCSNCVATLTLPEGWTHLDES